MADTRTTFNMGSQEQELQIFKRLTMKYAELQNRPDASERNTFKELYTELGSLFGMTVDTDSDNAFKIYEYIAYKYEALKKRPNIEYKAIYMEIRSEMKEVYGL